MKFDILSVVAGSAACNAKCPFCVSKMTPNAGLDTCVEINWRNLEKASRLARQSGVSTAMITGKGEPSLYPEFVGEYVRALNEYFPIIELQSNGLLFSQPGFEENLREWYADGLTTVSLSITHYADERNREIYCPKKEYPPLQETISLLHKIGYSVRLACVMAKGYIDSASELENLIDFARKEGVEQVSVRPVNSPKKSEDKEASAWVREHRVGETALKSIAHYLDDEGVRVMTTPYGAQVYDVDGQNVCFTNSLTCSPDAENVRQLIFFPDGHLRYDWQYMGAIIL